jgi:hypothetical protein
MCALALCISGPNTNQLQGSLLHLAVAGGKAMGSWPRTQHQKLTWVSDVVSVRQHSAVIFVMFKNGHTQASAQCRMLQCFTLQLSTSSSNSHHATQCCTFRCCNGACLCVCGVPA